MIVDDNQPTYANRPWELRIVIDECCSWTIKYTMHLIVEGGSATADIYLMNHRFNMQQLLCDIVET